MICNDCKETYVPSNANTLMIESINPYQLAERVSVIGESKVDEIDVHYSYPLCYLRGTSSSSALLRSISLGKMLREREKLKKLGRRAGKKMFGNQPDPRFEWLMENVHRPGEC